MSDASGHLVKVVQTLLDVTQDTYAAKTALERANAMWESALFCEKEYARSLAYKKIWDELRDGRVHYELVHQRTKANKSVWLRATLVPVKDASGRVVKVLNMARNATETHEALKDASTLVTAMDRLVGRIELDVHRRVIRVNKGFEVAFKAPAAHVMGRDLRISARPNSPTRRFTATSSTSCAAAIRSRTSSSCAAPMARRSGSAAPMCRSSRSRARCGRSC